MSDEKSGAPKMDRRALLKLVGAGAAASALPPVSGRAAADASRESLHDHAMSTSPAPEAPAAAAVTEAPASYVFLNADEAAFIEAAVDTLIPSDDVGPGARELGVAVFIDRQLASGYGRGDRLYLQGPFIEGTPEQGYQLRMTPSELMQAGIADVNAHVQEKFQSTFDLLSPQDRAAVLTELETRKLALPTVPTGTFFELLYDLTMLGYFSDPIHGGNKGKGSWKMIGFPGIGAMYADKIAEYRNKRYMVDPVSIQDLL
jgi:gluconate 2-dehydrogenase gamma chain